MKTKHNNIFYVIILMVLFVAACKFAGIGGSSDGINSNSDPKEALIGSLKNLQQIKSWAADVNTTNDAMPQAASKTGVKYLAPDKFHITSDTGGSKLEMILIGSDSYLLTNGKWQKTSGNASMGQMVNNWRQMYNDEKVGAFKNIQFAGEETVNGKKVLAYTYEIDSLAAMPEETKTKMTDDAKKQIAGMENKVKVWIEAEKNLPAKLEMTTKMTQPKEMTIKMNYDYRYDEEIKIEAPTLP